MGLSKRVRDEVVEVVLLRRMGELLVLRAQVSAGMATEVKLRWRRWAFGETLFRCDGDISVTWFRTSMLGCGAGTALLKMENWRRMKTEIWRSISCETHTLTSRDHDTDILFESLHS